MDQYSATMEAQSQRTYSVRDSATMASYDQHQFQDGASFMPSLPEDDDLRDEGNRWAARFVIAVDYGTTYTGVAWILTQGKEPTLDNIRHVFNWPGNRIEAKVPSRFTYSPIRGTERWGNGIGSDALVIRWTKLELEPPKRDKALEILRETISETTRMKLDPRARVFEEIPTHLVRTSEDIVTDYLSGVLAYARRDIEGKTDYANLTQMKIDLVITHPAVWDPRAKNITFRSVTTAFDNAFREVEYQLGNIGLVTESEACAQYLMKEARDRNLARIRVGECFIVVDAGGGTVDLAAYQVEEVHPRFRVRRLTTPLGSQCGATEIDRYFLKIFLARRLSPEDFAKLRGGEANAHAQGSHVVFTEKEEEILQKFLTIKHDFKGTSDTDSRLPPDQRLDLPEDIGTEDSPERGIVAGQLIIKNRELEEIFAPAVNGVIKLIGQQVNLLFAEGHQSGTIFLSGGFSRSEYLHRQVRRLGARCGFQVVRSDDDNSSWTAVAKGAVLMGLGLDCPTPPNNIPCPVNIGVTLSTRFRPYEHAGEQKYKDSFDGSDRARNHTHWIIKKGDLVTLEGKHASTKLRRKYNPNGNKTGIVKVLISDVGIRNTNASRSQAFLNPGQEIDLAYDLATVPKHVAKDVIHKTSAKGKSFLLAEMTLDVFVSHLYYSIELTCGKTVDILGGTGEAGFVLASKQVYFSNANRSTGIGSSFTAWGGSSTA